MRRNDEIDADEAERLRPSHLVVSPGPGQPGDSGATVEIVRRLAPTTPTLGVCLGHQAIVEAFGGEIGQARELVHGKASAVAHDGRGHLRRAAAGLPGRPLPLARRDRACPTALEVSATSRRRRGDGRSPPRAPGRRRAVPPRERPHAARARSVPRTSWADDPGRADGSAGRARSGPGAGARGDGRDHGRRGDAGPDRRLPRRAAPQGRDARRDRRLRRGDPRPRAWPWRRSGPTSSTPPGPAATGRRRSTSRPRRRWSRQRPAPASPNTATGRSPRHRARRTSSRHSASSSTCRPDGSRPRSTSSASASCSPPRTTRVSGTLRPCARNWRLGRSSTCSVRCTNPAGARAQLVGVYDPALVPTIAEVLARLDARRAFVVHGAFGVDELSPAGPQPRLRGGRRRGARADDRPASTWASPAARRRSCAAARPSRTPL